MDGPTKTDAGASLLGSLCHGVTACSAMEGMLNYQKRMQQGFRTWSAEEKQKGREAVAFLMTTVVSRRCPACKRPVR